MLRGADSITARPNDSLYTKYFNAEELADYHEMELGNVDAEIKLVRLRLARAMKMEDMDSRGELEARDAHGRTLSEELESRIERDGGGENVVHTERHFKKVDYRSAINACLGRIESLEKTRAELAKHASAIGNEDIATALCRLADRLPV